MQELTVLTHLRGIFYVLVYSRLLLWWREIRQVA